MKHCLKILCILGSIIMTINGMMPGGITDTEKPVSKDLRASLGRVEAEIRKSVNGPIESLVPVSYKSQVVAGVNYFVKYRVNNSSTYYHARIFRDLKGNYQLVKIKGPVSEAEPITYF